MGEEQVDVPDELREGPVRERSCTDIACLLLFAAFWGLCLFFLFRGIKTGDMSKIARPFDSDGNACGYVNANSGKDLSAFPYLYFNIGIVGTKPAIASTVCVKECPTDPSQPVYCSPNSKVKDCSDLVPPYAGWTFLKGFCIPNKQEFIDVIGALFTGFNIESILEAVYLNRMMFVYALGIAFLLSYLYSVFLQFCTWLVVVLTLVGIYVVGIYVSIVSWKRYNSLLAEPAADNTSSSDQISSDAKIYKWLAILIWITLSVLLIAIFLLFDRIKLAVNVIMAAGDFVADSTGIVFVPVCMVLLSFAYIGFWLYNLAAIFSTGELYYNPNYPWGKFKWTEELKTQVYIHGFALLWNMALFLTISHFVIACATAIWYFPSSRNEAGSPILRSIWWMFRYHIGSLALGSLLLALVWLVRIAAQYIHEKMKDKANETQVTKVVLKIALCLVDCLERFIKFFNKHAYVEIAMRGTNFCTSAGNGMKVVTSNFLRFGVLHGLGEVVMNFGVLLICMLGTYICFIIIQAFSPMKKEFHGTAVTLLIVALIHYAVAMLFSHIWEASSDTILHCFCIDEELEQKRGSHAKNQTDKLKYALDVSEQQRMNEKNNKEEYM